MKMMFRQNSKWRPSTHTTLNFDEASACVQTTATLNLSKHDDHRHLESIVISFFSRYIKWIDEQHPQDSHKKSRHMDSLTDFVDQRGPFKNDVTPQGGGGTKIVTVCDIILKRGGGLAVM